MQFHTRIRGIPAICRVLHYDPGTHYAITSASLEPNDPEEFEFEILDRTGCRAPWLEAKMTSDDEARLLTKYKGLRDEP